ncbi:unnamed protein product [Meloidogyne enterolobii]|uniref:Uncharacterized protein n=1 Tax=Meloidogyne enterolobii TaxID=390850 RepID=A0ACB0ZNG2_MELEN
MKLTNYVIFFLNILNFFALLEGAGDSKGKEKLIGTTSGSEKRNDLDVQYTRKLLDLSNVKRINKKFNLNCSVGMEV